LQFLPVGPSRRRTRHYNAAIRWWWIMDSTWSAFVDVIVINSIVKQ